MEINAKSQLITENPSVLFDLSLDLFPNSVLYEYELPHTHWG